MTRTKFLLSLSLFSLVLTLTGCKEDVVPQPATSLQINFLHKLDGNPLVTDSMMYTNAAGNNYEVTEIMYFISDIRMYHHDGREINPASWDDIHYIDTNIPETFSWVIGNDIPQGQYDSITFIFGISEAKNQSFMFVNPPEVNMTWPEVLGGGYHYMMLNGWWIDREAVRRPFNFHLGIGQIYANNSGQVADITGFVHNAFKVNPGGGAFTIEPGKANLATLAMHIESWFETPVIYNHNTFGGAIMQNQEAMHTVCLNGADVFSILWE